LLSETRKLLAVSKKFSLHLIIAISALFMAGVISIWPAYAFKLVADILASGQSLKGEVTIDLIPQQLINYGIHPWSLKIEPLSLLDWIPFVLLALLSFDGALRFLNLFHSRYFGVLVTNELRQRVYCRVLRFSVGELRKYNSADIASRIITDLSHLQNLLAEIMVVWLRDSNRLIIFVVWLLVLNWKLTIIGGIVLPIAFWGISRLFKRLRRLASRGQEISGQLSGLVTESAIGLEIIHLFANYRSRQRNFFQLGREYLNAWRKQLLLEASVGFLMGIVSAVGVGFIVIEFGLKEVLNDNMTTGDFASYVICSLRLYQPVKRLMRVNAQLNQMLGHCQRIFALAEVKTELYQENFAIRPRKRDFQELVLENVHFSYESSAQEVLSGINLDIRRGEKIALVGASGGGKSTLIKLLPKLYKVSSGRILLNGKNINDWNLLELRDQMSLVTQDCFLFAGSLRDNLLVAKSDANSTQMEEALERAGVDFLGLDDQINELANNLSGGQKQRIAIARAFLRDSPLLILDEPTSSLDRQTEEAIKDSLRQLMQKRTVILVTHRLDLIEDFGRIICFQAGQIVEEGTHQELLAKASHYARLFKGEVIP